MKLNVRTGYTPHRFQAEIHEHLGRFGVVVAHRRFGKTVFAVNELVHRAAFPALPHSRFGYLAPYLKQAKEIAWDYIKRYTRPITGATAHEGDLIVTLPNGSRIRLYGADNAEAMRGTYFDYVVIDEVADMRPDLWGEIIRPALADRKGGALFIGTPKGSNLLSELYHGAPEGWLRRMYRVDETDLIDAEELQLARDTMSDNQYRQEFLCDFSASADNVLITIDQVSEAAKRSYLPGHIEFAPVVLGVDVARFGVDRSVIIRRQGLQMFTPIIMQGIDNMELAGRVVGQIVEHSPAAVFVDAGRGEGVIDRLRQLGYSVIEVNFGGAASSPSYRNKRSEMWDEMAKWLRAGGSIPNLASLKTDLCTPTYSFSSTGKFELEDKEHIKERLGRSTDEGDAAALTFAFPVAPRTDPLLAMRQRRSRQSDDPRMAILGRS
ncbi:MAG: terminase family protein [Reyranellaceae bacterium]